MRITYLHQYFNTPRDSGGTRSYEMARRLVAAGHEVHMITSDRSKRNTSTHGWYQTTEAGINVHWLPVSYSNHMSFSQRIRAFFYFAFGAAGKAASIESDVIFATSTPLTIALPAVYAAKRQRIPMVFEVRDLWPETPIAMGVLQGKIAIFAARQLEKFAYQNSTQIIALSPGMKDGITQTGYFGDKVHVIPNSSDLDLFDVPKEHGFQFRRKFDWLHKRPLVVYTGALGKVNGVAYLAELAAKVLPNEPDIRFLVIGDGIEKSKVVDTAKQCDVWEKNFFLMEPVPKSQMPSILSAADIATSVVINRQELWANSANKFFDALAAGTPMAINHRGWQAEILEEHNAGIVLDAEDMDVAAIELINAIQDRNWLKQAGGAAKKLAKERFSRDLLSMELEKVLMDVVAKSS